MGEILGLVGQYGIFPVLIIVLGYAYDRKERKHEDDRKRWEEQTALERKRWEGIVAAERAACAEERDAWTEERRAREREEKLAGEKLKEQLLETQRSIVNAINSAAQMATIFETEKRDLRDARERELREGERTGQHRPVFPPRTR